jgi:hypothetical protein
MAPSWLWISVLAIAPLLAGCAQEAPKDDGMGGGAWSMRPLQAPDNITATQDVPASAMGVPGTGTGVLRACGEPGVSCYEFPFEIPFPAGWNQTMDAGANATAGDAADEAATPAIQVKAHLSWGVPSNDFDVALYNADGTEVVGDFASPPGTEANFQASAGPGKYVVLVTPFLVVGDTFTLDVTFAPA